jgi:hypothetical protein
MAFDVAMVFHLASNDRLSTTITALKLGISACVSDVIVHLVQGHFNATVEQAVHCSVDTNVLTVVSEIPSQQLAAKRVIGTFNRQKGAYLIVLVDFAPFYDLLAQFIRTLD